MMIRNRPTALTGAVLAGAAVLALAGCGGSSGGTLTAAAGGTTHIGSGGSDSSGAASGGLKGAVNVCSAVPKAAVAQIVGKPFGAAEEQDTPSYKLFDCNYTNDPTAGNVADAEQLDLSIVGEDGAAGYDADLSALQQVKGKVQTVSGIGDKAFSSGVSAQLEVLYGNVLIKISGMTAPTIDQSKEIVEQLHAKL